MRILIVSDIRVVQEGLDSVLAGQNGVDSISTADLSQAKHQNAQLNPDVVLFDAARRESIGIVRDLVASSPHTKVVAFGVRETEAEALALAAAGTAGCVRDSTASGDMVRALEKVLGDESPCPPSGVASGPRLSPRELQIAHLIETGLPNKAIGRQLGIEAATVKNHVHNLCEKLKVHRRGEVAARLRAILQTG